MITALIVLFVIVVYLFLDQPKFGRLPKGDRLQKIKSSGNYRDQKFQNLNETPDLTEGAGYTTILKEFFSKKKINIAKSG